LLKRAKRARRTTVTDLDVLERQALSGSITEGKVAVRALAQARNESALFNVLSSADNDDVRTEAARSLVNLDPTRPYEPLLEAWGFDDLDEAKRDLNVPWLFALGLEKLQSLLCVPIRSLTSGDERSRRMAALLLRVIGDRRAVEPLAQAIADPSTSDKTRLFVAEALASFGDIRAVEPLLKGLRNRSIVMRTVAAKGFERLGEPGRKALGAEVMGGTFMQRRRAKKLLRKLFIRSREPTD
jgi:HEAT repeat protein